MSGEFSDGQGIDYVANSFRVFGNDGTHTLNGMITTGTGASVNVLNALVSVSDHLPVVADFEIAGVPTTFSLKQQILQRITEIEQELAQLRAMVEQLPD